MTPVDIITIEELFHQNGSEYESQLYIMINPIHVHTWQIGISTPFKHAILIVFVLFFVFLFCFVFFFWPRGGVFISGIHGINMKYVFLVRNWRKKGFCGKTRNTYYMSQYIIKVIVNTLCFHFDHPLQLITELVGYKTWLIHF